MGVAHLLCVSKTNQYLKYFLKISDISSDFRYSNYKMMDENRNSLFGSLNQNSGGIFSQLRNKTRTTRKFFFVHRNWFICWCWCWSCGRFIRRVARHKGHKMECPENTNYELHTKIRW